MDQATIINIIFDLCVFWLAFFSGYIYGTKKEFERTIKMFDDWMDELDAKAKELEKAWEEEDNKCE